MKEIADILVIGGGPHALSFLAHLVEDTADWDRYWESPDNSVLFGKSHRKEDHREIVVAHRKAAQLHPAQAYRDMMKHVTYKSPRKAAEKVEFRDGGFMVKTIDRNSITVIDKTSTEFLGTWNRHFKTLDIKKLRSTTAQHVCPHDIWSMTAFATKNGRIDELCELDKVDRSDNFAGPYIKPTFELHKDFTEKAVIGRFFGKNPVIEKGEVDYIDIHDCGAFCIHLVSNDTERKFIMTKNVVLAIGHGNLPRWPEWVPNISVHPYPQHRLMHYQEFIDTQHDNCDICDSIREFLSRDPVCTHCGKRQEEPLSGFHLVIVGGGQTSIHLSQLAIQRFGCRRVTLIVRDKVKVQPFDISYSWMAKSRPISLAKFWSEPCIAKRAKMLAKSRGFGANISREMHDWLLKSEHVHLRQHTSILGCEWLQEANQWHLDIQTDRAEIESLQCDFIWLATGTEMNFTREHCVRKLVPSENIPCFNGLPILNKDLSLPLQSKTSGNMFVMGAYAALELGPGALNLMGARQGGCRIAHALKQRFSIQ